MQTLKVSDYNISYLDLVISATVSLNKSLLVSIARSHRLVDENNDNTSISQTSSSRALNKGSAGCSLSIMDIT